MNIIDTIRTVQHGFILEKQIDEIIAINRFEQVLVRCGNGRFLCPVQDVKHFIECIEKSGIDYVRDVSLPARV